MEIFSRTDNRFNNFYLSKSAEYFSNGIQKKLSYQNLHGKSTANIYGYGCNEELQ